MPPPGRVRPDRPVAPATRGRPARRPRPCPMTTWTPPPCPRSNGQGSWPCRWLSALAPRRSGPLEGPCWRTTSSSAGAGAPVSPSGRRSRATSSSSSRRCASARPPTARAPPPSSRARAGARGSLPQWRHARTRARGATSRRYDARVTPAWHGPPHARRDGSEDNKVQNRGSPRAGTPQRPVQRHESRATSDHRAPPAPSSGSSRAPPPRQPPGVPRPIRKTVGTSIPYRTPGRPPSARNAWTSPGGMTTRLPGGPSATEPLHDTSLEMSRVQRELELVMDMKCLGKTLDPSRGTASTRVRLRAPDLRRHAKSTHSPWSAPATHVRMPAKLNPAAPRTTRPWSPRQVCGPRQERPSAAPREGSVRPPAPARGHPWRASPLPPW